MVEYAKIVSIEEVGEVDMIDIEVTGNRLFYANDILTHNSGYGNSDVELTDTSECIWVNEKIELRNGTKLRLGDVKIGDQIVSNDGYKTVMMVHHPKKKECYKIKLKSGKEIIVSGDHIFPTNIGRMSINTGFSVGSKVNTSDNNDKSQHAYKCHKGKNKCK